MLDKSHQERLDKRAKILKETEDRVRTHMSEPWSDPLYDYVLYIQMNRVGIRVHDIPSLIEKELKKQVP